MCGIAGIISHQKQWGAEIVAAMNQLQTHRGPDGSGIWSSENGYVHFGHQRLSIIDLSEAGAQPMQSEDGQFVITYNGEIYNFSELREKCIQKGSKFFSRTDTEVIIEYIRHFGKDGIKDFRGMWAFVLYNTKTNTIIMSRDPFGIKPLYYGIKDEVLYFSSEIKALRCTLPYFNTIDTITERMFIEHGVLDLGKWTFFKNIKRFPHAHHVEIDLNHELDFKPQKYWTPPQQVYDIEEKEAIKTLQNLLEQSIKRHMVADVDIAFCLSGGLDSSTIVGIAHRHSKNNQKLKTFTTRYPDFPEIDETQWAKLAIDHCNTDHEFVQPTLEEFMSEFDKVIYHHDEPFGSTSVYAQNTIFKAIHRSQMKVSLDGQGADEIFAGYHSYFPIFLMTLLHRGKFLTFVTESIALALKHPRLGLKLFGNQMGTYLRKRGLQPKRTRPTLDQEYQQRLDEMYRLYRGDFHQNLVNALVATSIPQLLRNGDRNSMKNSVESRVPFLDLDLVNFVISLPDRFKIRRAVTKYILRQTSLSYLPQQLVNRKDKLGFPSPEKLWLKKAFNMDVSGPFSKDFRVFMVKRWKEVIQKTRHDAFV